MNEHPSEKDAGKEKWNFDDYAYTITGIVVGILVAGPIVLDTLLQIIFDIGIFDGILGGTAPVLSDWLEAEAPGFNQYRFLTPVLFLLTTTICFFKDAIDARKSGGYSDSWFTYDFESLLEEAIYLALATITVFSSILVGAMWASWLAAPVSWVLFVFILPLVKKKNSTDKIYIPWLCLFIFAVGIIAEIITGAWIAFPLSWLIICAIKLIGYIRKAESSLNTVYNISYSALSVIVIAVGIVLNFWLISWTPILIALLICWVFSKFKRFKKMDKINE